MHIIIALIASLALLLPGSGILAQSMIESDRGPAANLSQDEPDFDDRLDGDFDLDFDGDFGDTLGDRGSLHHREHDFGDISQAPDQSQSQPQSQNQEQNQNQAQDQDDTSAQNSNSTDASTSKRDGRAAQGQSSTDSATQQGNKTSQGASLGTPYSIDGFIA